MRFSTVAKFFDDQREKPLPTVDKELSVFFIGPSSNHTEVKATNRRAEILATYAETAALRVHVTEGGVLFISNGDGTCKIKGSDKIWQGSITVPEKSPYGDTVTTMATGAFKSFRLLTSVTLPDTVTVIGDSAFQGCGSLVSVELPPAVTQFGRAVFDGCRALQSVVLPKGLTEIPSMTFQTCVNLQSVVAQDGITHIGANAFNGCRSMATLTLPAGLESVGAAAFMNCCGLQTVYFGGTREEWEAVEIHEYDNGNFVWVDVVFQ